jgi:hypothetical protein
MDHNLTIKNHLAERYLLGELTECEQEAYEEHFFECAACAEEVRLGSEFLQHARDVLAGAVCQLAVAEFRLMIGARLGLTIKEVWYRSLKNLFSLFLLPPRCLRRPRSTINPCLRILRILSIRSSGSITLAREWLRNHGPRPPRILAEAIRELLPAGELESVFTAS